MLSDITWGSGVTSAKVISELKKITAFASLADDASAATVAKAISDAGYTGDSPEAQAVAAAIEKAVGTAAGSVTITKDSTDGKGEITGLAAGYYLVKDSATVGENGALTRFILQVVDNVDVKEKASVPTIQKKVKRKERYHW